MKLTYIGNTDECFICKKRYRLETHHIMNGPYKKASERHGLLIKVCGDCHRMAPDSIHRNSKMMRRLKKFGQKYFEQTHTREEFIKEFGKNYLMENEGEEEKEWRL